MAPAAWQRSIVAGLQRDFKRIKDQNADLRSDLQFERGFSAQLTDQWVTGRLDGRSIIVLTSGEKTEGGEAAVSAIKDAGGNPVVVTLLLGDFGLNNSKVAGVTLGVGAADTVAAAPTGVKAANFPNRMAPTPVFSVSTPVFFILTVPFSANTPAKWPISPKNRSFRRELGWR